MTLESLLLSRDAEVVRVLRPTLEKLSIEVEICQEAKKASEILISEKFDAVIVDCDDLPGGLEVLQGLRATPSNKNSVTFAVLNGKKTTTQEAFGMGVNFVLQKPISNLNASRCFHAALSFMERERRRYFRQPVKMPVRVVLDEKELRATSTNISEGGIALHVAPGAPQERQASFAIHAARNPNGTGRGIGSSMGRHERARRDCAFAMCPQSSQELLEQWLNQQMEQPGPAAQETAGRLQLPTPSNKPSFPPQFRQVFTL